MSEDVKPIQFTLFKNTKDEVELIELSPIIQLLEDMVNVIKNHNCFKGTTYFDGEDRVITECETCNILEKYRKFKEELK